MKLSELISTYLKEKNISQRQFAKKCDMSNGYISMLVNNINPRSNEPIAPSLTALISISNALGITLEKLFEICDDIPVDISKTKKILYGDEEREKENIDLTKFSNIFPINKRRIPLLGTIACGEPIFADEDRESYVEIGTDVRADFCLKCKGDSMIGARIQDGDIVFIRKQDMVDNGEIAAVIIEDESTLKRVFYYPDEGKLFLQAENSKYPPLVYIGDELNNVRILGKAIAFQSDVS